MSEFLLILNFYTVRGYPLGKKHGIGWAYRYRIGYLYNDSKLDKNDIEPLDKLKIDIVQMDIQKER